MEVDAKFLQFPLCCVVKKNLVIWIITKYLIQSNHRMLVIHPTPSEISSK